MRKKMAPTGVDDDRLVGPTIDLICDRKFCVFLLLCLFSSVYAHQISQKDANGQKSVVVVGSGIAGLAAARSLANTGLWDVTLLEARKSRYGGRVWTDRVTFNRIKGDYLIHTKVTTYLFLKETDFFLLDFVN